MGNTKISVKRNPPVNLTKEHEDYFAHEFNLEIQEAKVHTLHKVYIDHRGYFINLMGVQKQSYLLGNPIIYTKLLSTCKALLFGEKKVITIKEPVIWLEDGMSSNYFHWFGETLPRFFNVKEKNALVSPKIILTRKLAEWDFIKDSLNMLGIEFLIMEDNQLIYADTVYISESLAPTGNYNPIFMQKLRRAFHEKLKTYTPDPAIYNKVYISRKLASKRKIVNEKEVEKLLTEQGFKTWYFEKMSFKEQALLCFGAKRLISIHGAGLTNMLFMNNNASVLEFRHQNDRICNCYFSLTSALNLSYFYQICECINGTDPHSADIIVDIEQLKKNIASFLQETTH